LKDESSELKSGLDVKLYQINHQFTDMHME